MSRRSKIVLTDELLDYLGEEYQNNKKNEMSFGEYVEFKMWVMENENKMNRHYWLREGVKKEGLNERN